ncbi:MAG: hypothetical protein OHK0039_14660 [Bacteroidia bacterium]
MTLAIFGRITENTDLHILAHFFHFLRQRQIPFMVYGNYAQDLYGRIPEVFEQGDMRLFHRQEELRGVDFLYSFGGDGTVLEAVRFVAQLEIPIVGVNFGRLGYLTCVTQQGLIPATEELMRGTYQIEKRSLLSVISEPPGLFGEYPYGINDLTIHKSKTNEMITVHTYINGEFLNSYWGDGLIVATPTGSTAYSLSCGGPIIFPSSATFAITPVAPHSLTVRPVVIPDTWVVSFEIESRSGEAMIALDTRTELVKARTSIAVRQAGFQVRLVRISSTMYIDNLRRSLMWGKDNRN